MRNAEKKYDIYQVSAVCKLVHVAFCGNDSARGYQKKGYLREDILRGTPGAVGKT